MPRFRVRAGPDPNSLSDITHIINAGQAHSLKTQHFEGQIAANIKGFTNPQGEVVDGEYFSREDRQDDTWSIQIQGRFLEPISSDDLLFGNAFDRTLNLPWGSSAVLKYMSYKDPTLEHDLGSVTRPWSLSPLISSMPHLAHAPISNLEQLPEFPPKTSITDNVDRIHHTIAGKSEDGNLSAPSRGSSRGSSPGAIAGAMKSSILKKTGHVDGSAAPGVQTLAQKRRTFFQDKENRKEVTFGPDDILIMDFCHGYLEFSPHLGLRIPGGVSFDLEKHWDGQPVRFVCCKRNKDGSGGEELWETIFWCIQIEPAGGEV